jgi:hypothetical protein
MGPLEPTSQSAAASDTVEQHASKRTRNRRRSRGLDIPVTLVAGTAGVVQTTGGVGERGADSSVGVVRGASEGAVTSGLGRQWVSPEDDMLP